MKKKVDIAALTMSLLAFGALFISSFVIVLENRISKMEHQSGIPILGGYFWILVVVIALLVLLVLWKDEGERRNFITGLWASFCIGITMFFMGLATNIIMEGRRRSSDLKEDQIHIE